MPTTKLDSCWAGTPGQPYCSPSRGVANGLQNGSALSGRQAGSNQEGVRLVGERLAATLTLHVVGEHDVAALGEVLGQPRYMPSLPCTEPSVITTPGKGP